MILPIRDKTLPTVIACIDATLRRFGGCPTYGLTDNEKTVTIEHVARIPVRNQGMVDAARHYGLTVATCLPADAPTKGGSEATVRVAKADLVPTDANLLAAYRDWAALEDACAALCEEVNGRPHRVTRRRPVEMLADEGRHLHALPEQPWTSAFGETRVVGLEQPTIVLDGCLYSVPWRLGGETVWVRRHGSAVIVTHVGPQGPTEVARHEETTPGSPRIDDAHFPPPPEGSLRRTPVAGTEAEAEFLAIGEGAARWLIAAGAAGASRVRVRMAEAVTLARLAGADAVDRALERAALHGRFGEGDLASILSHALSGPDGEALRADEAHSLQPGTGAWRELGR